MAKIKPRAKTTPWPRRVLSRPRVALRSFLNRRSMLGRWKHGPRFVGHGDWRRIMALGIVLVDFSILGFYSSTSGKLPDYLPGMSSMFGGLLVCIIMLRLSRPAIYLDWVALGLIQICLGFQVQLKLTSVFSGFVVFQLGLVVSASLLIVIGFRTPFFEGRSSLLAGGICSLIVSATSVVESLVSGQLSPDNILLITLTIMGLSLVGMSSSIRRENH